MSTGADCTVREVAPGQWQYEVQCYPYGATEDYDTQGPFRSYAAAMTHLDNHYPNPGGHSCHPLDSGHVHEYDVTAPGALVRPGRCLSCGGAKEVPDAVVSR